MDVNQYPNGFNNCQQFITLPNGSAVIQYMNNYPSVWQNHYQKQLQAAPRPARRNKQEANSERSKRTRIKFTPDQRATLEQFFFINNYPDAAQMGELANQLNLKRSSVKFWFQNKRQYCANNGIETPIEMRQLKNCTTRQKPRPPKPNKNQQQAAEAHQIAIKTTIPVSIKRRHVHNVPHMVNDNQIQPSSTQPNENSIIMEQIDNMSLDHDENLIGLPSCIVFEPESNESEREPEQISEPIQSNMSEENMQFVEGLLQDKPNHFSYENAVKPAEVVNESKPSPEYNNCYQEPIASNQLVYPCNNPMDFGDSSMNYMNYEEPTVLNTTDLQIAMEIINEDLTSNAMDNNGLPPFTMNTPKSNGSNMAEYCSYLSNSPDSPEPVCRNDEICWSQWNYSLPQQNTFGYLANSQQPAQQQAQQPEQQQPIVESDLSKNLFDFLDQEWLRDPSYLNVIPDDFDLLNSIL